MFPTHMLSLESVLGFCHGITKGGDCKVELSTILLALFHAKFACILAISNPVFRWDFCKGSEWDSVKKYSRVCKKKQGLMTGSRGWLAAVSRQKLLMCQACQKLKCHVSWSITGQNRTTGHSVTSRLELATQSSREPALFWKTWLFTFHSHPSINTPFYPWKKESFQRELWERNPREK